MESKKIFLTAKGLEDLKKEYQELVDKKVPEIVARLSAAREMGDLSENAEYNAAREELSFVDGRVEELEALIKRAQIISDDGHSTTSIELGSKVCVQIKGKEEIFTVVGEWEADPAEKKISHESPLGKALMGKNIGDMIEVDAPAGKMVYKIVSVN